LLAREQLQERPFTVDEFFHQRVELLRLGRVFTALCEEHAPDGVVLDYLRCGLTSSPDEADLVARSSVPTHAKGEIVLVDDEIALRVSHIFEYAVLRLDPHHLRLQIEAPHVHDREGLLLHRCHAPEEEQGVIGDRRQLQSVQLVDIHALVVRLGPAHPRELVPELPGWICDYDSVRCHR
jgi:hypothetical protein